jgi:hypothetical protein
MNSTRTIADQIPPPAEQLYEEAGGDGNLDDAPEQILIITAELGYALYVYSEEVNNSFRSRIVRFLFPEFLLPITCLLR